MNSTEWTKRRVPTISLRASVGMANSLTRNGGLGHHRDARFQLEVVLEAVVVPVTMTLADHGVVESFDRDETGSGAPKVSPLALNPLPSTSTKIGLLTAVGGSWP